MARSESSEVMPEHGDAVIMSLDRGVIRDPSERSVNNRGRDAVGDRHLLEGGKPFVESFGARAAFRGAPGRSAQDGGKCGGEGKGLQISSSHRRLRPPSKNQGSRFASRAGGASVHGRVDPTSKS